MIKQKLRGEEEEVWASETSLISISCISHLLTAESWANNLASQDLTFLIYKMDIMFNIIDLVRLLWELEKKSIYDGSGF